MFQTRYPVSLDCIPNFTYFPVTLELGMKHGLEDQTKAQRQGDFTDQFIVYEEFAWCVQGYGIPNH
jgi:hypothetical protein